MRSTAVSTCLRKHLGEFVEHHFDTPSVSAEELKAMMDGGEKMVVLDSRPMDEYNTMNIPTGVCCPGGELVYRLGEIVPDADTTVVVNCAGRTRSIIGAQSLINAGVKNKVVALRNGTMGWHLSGFQLEHGNTHAAPQELSGQAIDAAKARVAEVAKRFEVGQVDLDTAKAWLADDSRTTFLLDVRHPHEYEAGHLPGSISSPGGQLVQATDRYAWRAWRKAGAGRRRQSRPRHYDCPLADPDALGRACAGGRGCLPAA